MCCCVGKPCCFNQCTSSFDASVAVGIRLGALHLVVSCLQFFVSHILLVIHLIITAEILHNDCGFFCTNNDNVVCSTLCHSGSAL